MPYDDDPGYSGEPLPRRRTFDYDDEDDEPLPRPPRGRRGGNEEDLSSAVTSLGMVGIIFGVLHVVGAVSLCVMGTVFAGAFVGMGQLIANDPNAGGGPGGQQQAKQAIDVCNGFGVFSGLIFIAPAIVYSLGAIGLVAGGWGVMRRRSWARTLLLIATPTVFLLDGGSFVLNPISGAIAGILALGYAIFAYIVLLMPENAEEFA